MVVDNAELASKNNCDAGDRDKFGDVITLKGRSMVNVPDDPLVTDDVAKAGMLRPVSATVPTIAVP